MTSIRPTLLYICCLVCLLQFISCRSTPPSVPEEVANANRTGPSILPSAEDKIRVFFTRNANYRGGGRTHILKIDDKTIGRLSGDNYYQLDMWPGKYQVSVALPREEFFGQVSLPDNIGRQIILKSHPDGRAYACSYTDGLGSSGLSLEPIGAFPEHLNSRSLDRSLTARETAQVPHLYKARYDGPAISGRPHGQGTLSWPDGSQYKGTFLHGEPTRKARFIFPGGHIFMGPYVKGRPASNGVLMNAAGDILYAGNFSDEKPHGVGLRSGALGPEFCIYDSGNDITKTFRQLAKEALDIEDPQTMERFLNRIADIEAQIEALKRRRAQLAGRHDPDRMRKTAATYEKKIRSMEKRMKRFESNMEADNAAFAQQMQETRFKRELTREKHFRKLHQAKIDQERQWCEDELDKGRNLCGCAPFAKNFPQWEECWEPLRPRFID